MSSVPVGDHNAPYVWELVASSWTAAASSGRIRSAAGGAIIAYQVILPTPPSRIRPDRWNAPDRRSSFRRATRHADLAGRASDQHRKGF